MLTRRAVRDEMLPSRSTSSRDLLRIARAPAGEMNARTDAGHGALEHIIFGRNEPTLHHYHNTYRAKLGLAPLPLLEPEAVAAQH